MKGNKEKKKLLQKKKQTKDKKKNEITQSTMTALISLKDCLMY
jgi:hypothetical protein